MSVLDWEGVVRGVLFDSSSTAKARQPKRKAGFLRYVELPTTNDKADCRSHHALYFVQCGSCVALEQCHLQCCLALDDKLKCTEHMVIACAGAATTELAPALSQTLDRVVSPVKIDTAAVSCFSHSMP